MDTTNIKELLAIAGAAQSIDATDKARAVEGLYATGHWLLSNERFKDAADVLRAMCIVAPQDERAWVALGAAHEGAGHDEVAREIYAVGCTLAQDSIKCGVALVRVLRRLGDEDAAGLMLEQVELRIDEQTDDELRKIVAYERRAA